MKRKSLPKKKVRIRKSSNRKKIKLSVKDQNRQRINALLVILAAAILGWIFGATFLAR